MEIEPLRKFFRLLNKYFMVPVYRLGLGSFISNPLVGYIMVIKTIGRKTGLVRYAPVNYAILDGCVYCMASWGTKAHWYRNMKAHPAIDVILPGGVLAGDAEDVSDPKEWLQALRQILKNAGFAGFFLGFNPFTAPDEVLRQKCEGLPVVRIQPVGVHSGASDPGGRFWLFVGGLAGLLLFYGLRKRQSKK